MEYQIRIFGVEIFVGSSKYYFSLNIYDKTNTFLIYYLDKYFITYPQRIEYIQIQDIKFDKCNYNVYTNLHIKFYIPRTLDEAEYLRVDLTKGLIDYNLDISKMNFQLVRLMNKEKIAVSVVMEQYKLRFLLVDNSLLSQDNYELIIYNILTAPDDNYYNADFLTISFARTLNSETVIQNIPTTSVTYPKLQSIPISESAPKQYNFDLEGAVGEYIFSLTSQTTKLDINSEILVFFPSYYSTILSNDDNSLQCIIYHPLTAKTYLIKCGIVDSQPYVLRITQFPFSIDRGVTFDLKIFGVNNPKRIYAVYSSERIFIGISA